MPGLNPMFAALRSFRFSTLLEYLDPEDTAPDVPLGAESALGMLIIRQADRRDQDTRLPPGATIIRVDVDLGANLYRVLYRYPVCASEDGPTPT